MNFAVTRLVGIVGVSIAVSTGYSLARQVPWVPDVQALADQQTLHLDLRATVGISLDEFLAFIEAGAVVVDTRPAEAFEEGHLAAPETFVLNVPIEEFDEHLPDLMDFLGSRFVLYCTSETCDFSEEVYRQMVAAGFDPADLSIYFPGWEGIVEAGLETAESVELSVADRAAEWLP